MIRVENLGFGYGTGAAIFDGFSFHVGLGEAWTIIGPSGCGKTTLLYLVAGLNRVEKGSIKIAGEIVARPRPLTGLVLQDHGLLPWATVVENARLGLKVRTFYGPDGRHSPLNYQKKPEQEEERVQYWLHWLGIDHLQEMFPSQLSRGQRQRAAIARTLVLEPDLLLMDEPFSALDAPIREELQKVMNGFHQQSGLTSLTVTHDIDEALILGEKILVLNSQVNTSPVVIENPCYKITEDPATPLFQKEVERLKRLLAGEGNA